MPSATKIPTDMSYIRRQYTSSVLCRYIVLSQRQDPQYNLCAANTSKGSTM